VRPLPQTSVSFTVIVGLKWMDFSFKKKKEKWMGLKNIKIREMAEFAVTFLILVSLCTVVDEKKKQIR
jgi:hypothetical protein